jgi:hypothetical protein
MTAGEVCTLPQEIEGLQRALDRGMTGFADNTSEYFCHFKPSVSHAASFGKS